MAGRILVVGATSAIAEVACRLWVREGASLALAGRDGAKLDKVAAHLRAAGADHVTLLSMDATDPTGMARLIGLAAEALGGLDAVLVAHGSLTEQALAERDPAYLASEIAVNLTSVAVVAEAAAAYFRPLGRGMIAVIGSVAGDRGKSRNYLYGMAKAALATQFEGLRQRLAGSGVRALLIKPGPVDTPMTATHKKSKLFVSADRVGADVVRAMAGRGGVVYTPGRWRWMMLVLRHLPEAVWIRLSL